MLPVKHLAPNILMLVNYCERQLVRRFRWAAPSFLGKGGASPRPGVHMCSLLDGRRHDQHFVVQSGYIM